MNRFTSLFFASLCGLMLWIAVPMSGVSQDALLTDEASESVVDPSKIPMQRPTIPERDPRNAEDEKRVIYFFSFSCTFCMSNDIYFWQWGLSLPKGVEFEPVPIIPSGDDYISMARAFYAADFADHKRIAHFMAKVYEKILLNPGDPKSLDTYMDCAQEAEIDTGLFEKNWNGSRVMSALLDARRRFTHYQPDTTPSLLINGKYMISPDLTNGDYNLFFQLASGLLSRYLVASGQYKG